MATFIDKATIHVKAGDGGKGCSSVRREKFKPLAGPDGGNGGRGGSIIFEADSQITTLLDYKYKSHLLAKNGEIGRGSNKDGQNAADLVLKVPLGTVVKIDEEPAADLDFTGKRFIAAQGGAGGLGNAALANKKNISPKFALLGIPGDERDIVLELKSIADVGLIGFPSVGKSSIIAAMSAAKPKIADYPFTTLVPNLGVVDADGKRYTIADVPGLVPGASEGKGMGYEFLRHIERVSILLHVIDMATLEADRNPVQDVKTIERELENYGGIFHKKRAIVLNKMDAPDAKEIYNMAKEGLEEFGWPIFPVSATSHAGLKELNYYLLAEVEKAREQTASKESEEDVSVITIASKQEGGAKVEKIETSAGQYFRVTGRLPELWSQQINWNNEDAVVFFSASLDKLGVEKELTRLGVRAGDEIRIGKATKTAETACIFEYVPNEEDEEED